MKFLHTSDWHLGQSLYGYDRCSEGADMLRQLAAIVADEQPDALVVAGDVFHTAMPSSRAQHTYVNGMLALHEACPAMSIVVIAGNHDSAARLAAYGSLWRLAGVTIAATAADAMAAVEVPGALIVPVAYRHPSTLRDTAAAAIAAARDRAGNRPVIAVAHQAISGADYKGHYRQPYFDDALSLAAAGLDGADYVALGHIHRPQPVAGSSDRACYCGSPLPVHFDEATYVHGVDIVTIDGAGAVPTVTRRPVAAPVPLLTVPDDPVAIDDAIEAMRALPNEPCYVRLNVATSERWLPGDAKTRAVDAAREAGSDDDGLPIKRFCEFAVIHTGATTDAPAAVTTSIAGLTTMEPVEAARRFLEHKGMEPLSPDELAIFQSLNIDSNTYQ